MTKKRPSHCRHPTVSLGILLSLLLLSTVVCTTITAERELVTNEPTAAEAVVVQTDAQVRRERPQVCAGSGDPSALPELQDGEWHNMFAEDLITTDENGEGWLKISDCMLIYVFQDSRLVKSACPKSDYVGGNVTCSVEGTSVYNNKCAGQVVIQTLTAELEMQGTWLSVTYLPETQLSLVIVFEGAVEAQPVVDPETRTLAPAVDVPVAHFWFTTPGAQADPIAGLAAREPHPLAALLPVVEDMNLGPWLERIEARAAADNVPFPELVAEAPTALPTDVPPTPATPPPSPATPPPLPTTPPPPPTTPPPPPTTPPPSPTTPPPPPTASTARPCVHFEDLASGMTFKVGDTFSTSGAIITVESYFVPEGFVVADTSSNILAESETWFDGGKAQVFTDYPWSGIQVGGNLVNFGFDFGGPISGLSLKYAYDGGGYNIEINGDFQTFLDFDALNGLTIGGVDISVSTDGSKYRGTLELTGTIDSFNIGGPYVWFDDVCPQ